MNLRLLIRTPNHLGDCIMALPMINEVREVYPGSTITLLVPHAFASLFEHLPSIDRVLSIPNEYVHGLRGVLKVQEIIEEGNYDIGYVLPPSFGAAAAFKLAGVKERIGYVTDRRRLLLTKPLPLSHEEPKQHRSQSYFDLLRRGSGSEAKFSPPKLFLNDHDHCNSRNILSQLGINHDQSYIAVAFQAVAESRRWGLERYSQLILRIIRDEGICVVLIGSASEQKSGDEVLGNVGKNESVVNVAGKTSSREMSAIISGARIFVGNDSGPAHVAAAVSTPLVVLSGADDPDETSPVSDMKRLVYCRDLECISCVKNVCPLLGDKRMLCMHDISVEEVFSQVRELLEQYQ